MIRVFLADDDQLVRSTLRALLSAEPDMSVVGEAASAHRVIEGVRATRPDVVLMDVRMPGPDGVAATREILRHPPPHPRILVLTTFDLDEIVDGAIAAGADGFLLKRATPEEIVAAIRAVAGGDAVLSPQVTRRLLRDLAARPRPAPLPVPLTDRESDVLRELARGLSNPEIADTLGVSLETVKTHVKAVLLKVGARDRTQAAAWAYRTGFPGLP
ncbi:response regulator transcription factor [Actinocorallia sp. A-T 12471]|uniref:response regulator transcription factor n=1 Tax=Actinocorallia sp. A-T 12471 TaxID=3089813 RepID=UPI0029CDBCA8|nr:response regulator transcription factor [Actinocorallia sp. A-T 12471]MDX6741054.1 response regulator transcription factor [Actinocorallia sp. A-T 12471]